MRELGTVVAAVARCYDTVNSFDNGFGNQVKIALKNLKNSISNISADVFIDGYASFDDAIQDIKTRLGETNREALAIEATLNAISNIRTSLDALDLSDTGDLSVQGTALKVFVDTIASEVPKLQRV